MSFARRQIMDVVRREEAHRVDLLEKELILVRKELGHVANEDNIGKEVKKRLSCVFNGGSLRLTHS